MNQDLLHQVVSFVNDGRTRDALGYSWERCTALRLAPCKLVMDPHVNTLLTEYFARRRRSAYTHVYHSQERIFVVVTNGFMMVHTGVEPNWEQGPGCWWQLKNACSRSEVWDYVDPLQMRVRRGGRRGTDQDEGKTAWVTTDNYVVK